MNKGKTEKIKKSYSDRVFDIVNIIIMLALLVIFLWPLWFVVIASFSNPNEVWNGNVILLPKGFTLSAYEAVSQYKMIWTGYKNTIIYTVVGTFINLYYDHMCGLSAVKKGICPAQLPDVYIHAHHVFQRRPDSHLSGGEQNASSEYPLGNDDTGSCFHL